ncbi:L-Aspartase-like protein [Lasiosphaeria hispida]|uniref:L-Aspartase-like protein n=1 Tax=Lasiosphaeria hispida TaxID=260671 RepID=A0AAJ0HDH7_9PEZI|nr:L-Aspartase-like protein [Lasiosphaeria hispida]
MHDMCTPHAKAVFTQWVALRKALDVDAALPLNGQDLSIADVVAVSLHGAKASLTDDSEVLARVDESVAFLAKELADGRVIYGVNTGFGGSADTRTQDFERLQSAAIQHLNVGILLHADKGSQSRRGKTNQGRENELLRSHALPNPIVKAAMLVRCNSLMRGHSGVRLSVIESIMKLLSSNMTPVVPLRGSISASGDLSTLSYIAGAIEGNPDVFVKVSNQTTKMVLPANQVLETIGLQPVRLQAKEGLGITNGTAPSCAAASIVIHEANQLALLTQLLTAMGTETLAGTAHNYHPFISATRPHVGQAEVASNISKFLSGSGIASESGTLYHPVSFRKIGLAQDRYALRTAPQWIGPQLEDLMLATRQIEVELNSTTDNPLIDTVGGRVHHGGNFQAAAITSAMEKTITALQNLGRLIFAQSSELINNATNKGLPPNLSADEPSQSFTFKGFDVNMAAYMAELSYLAHPVSAHMQVAEMANQSVNSMALVAARYALEAVEIVSLMAATYIYALCQALDLRCIQFDFEAGVKGGHLGSFIIEMFSLEGDGKDTVLWVTHNPNVVFTHDKFWRSTNAMTDAILDRWSELSHLDGDERCNTTARDSLGMLMESIATNLPGLNPTTAQMMRLQAETARILKENYSKVKSDWNENDSVAHQEHVSPASKVVYNYVRKELGIPLNRGVADHPPLLLRAAKEQKANGADAQGAGKEQDSEELSTRGRISGTMAGEIYEGIRGGELHDRIMKFMEKNKFCSE